MKGSIPATQLCVCVYVSQLVSASVCVHVCNEFVRASCPGYSEINTTNDYHFHKPPSTASIRPLSEPQHPHQLPPHTYTIGLNKPPPLLTHNSKGKCKNEKFEVYE